MEKNLEQYSAGDSVTASLLPQHISENLSSPLLRAAWLVELRPDLHEQLVREAADQAKVR
jgi:hypothetical protein